jgi:tRNA-splicing ligase RtcB (3'-phosphate/5'-hydroxy nucleic acid ligase)
MKDNRTFEEDLSFIEEIDPNTIRIKKGFVPNMRVEGMIFVDASLKELLFEELKHFHNNPSGFLPALFQIANVASLPGIINASYGLPDIHSGYGFAIGNVAGFDIDDPESVVSPGGVGFDINCGVRFLRTNLNLKNISHCKDDLTKALFEEVPVGVGTKGHYSIKREEYKDILENGMKWALKNGLAWKEDLEHCESNGCIPNANSNVVGQRAKDRGFTQLGTLGSGNHYAEIQAIEEIYDIEIAKIMGLNEIGQVCIMIHSGSRGLGHQVASEALEEIDKVMNESNVQLNDRQLACTKINSPQGQKYLQAMAAAANFAFVNRTLIANSCRKAFSKVFNKSPEELDMHVVYDVAHNIAKIEEHIIDGEVKKLLVHRKGSTRAFCPGHEELPSDYKPIGQPVLVGGSMGTASYILVGTQTGMNKSLGSTCHGAGRAISRNLAKKTLSVDKVLQDLKDNGISICVGTPQAITEEAPEAYKDVNQVIEICHNAGISKKVVKLRPIGVIKG